MVVNQKSGVDAFDQAAVAAVRVEAIATRRRPPSCSATTASRTSAGCSRATTTCAATAPCAGSRRRSREALPRLFVQGRIKEAMLRAARDSRAGSSDSDADRFRAVMAGVVDAAAASTEFVPIAPSGVKLLVHAHEAVPNYVRLCLYASGKTLVQRRDQLVSFLAAQMEGVRHALNNRDDAIKLAKEMTDAKPDDPRAAYIYDEVVRYSAITPDMPIPMDKLAWMRELLTKTGNLTKPLDLAKLIDDGPRARTLELAGK